MNWIELMQHPDGVIFCENNLGSSPLYIKQESLHDDVMIKPVYDSIDDGVRRMGWREMDECDRNSAEYHVLSEVERNNVVLRVIGPYALAS